MRRLAVGLFIGAATLALPGIAGGGGMGGGSLTVDPTSGPPGSTFTVSGTGCVFEFEPPTDQSLQAQGNVAAGGTEEPPAGPEVTVTVNFASPVTMTTTADPELGNWSVTFTVPAGTPAGSYSIEATCFNTPQTRGDVSAADFNYPGGAFNVLAVAGAQTPAPLPGTPAPGAPAPAGTAPAPTPAGSVTAAPGFTG